MRERDALPRVPQVNLLRSPRRRVRLAVPRRAAEVLLVALAVLAWGTALIAIGLLLGWRPHLALGP